MKTGDMADDPVDDRSLPARVRAHFRNGEYSMYDRGLTDLICESVGGDLIAASTELANAAQQGELVAERNYTPTGHRFYQDLDFAIGSAPDATQHSLITREAFPTGAVEDVWFALNAESLVSSIQKNWKNRGKDIHSFYLGVYDVAPLAVTGAVIVLNVADLEVDPNEIINSFREFDFAGGTPEQSLDALAVVPVWYTEESPQAAELSAALIPEDDELHYTSFISTIAAALERRLQSEERVSAANIDSVLSQEESEVLEFQPAVPDRPLELAKEIAALANHKGGTILLGVEDKGTPVGLADVDAAEQRVTGLLTSDVVRSVQKMERARVDGADVLILNVEWATTSPVEVDGTFYVRSDSNRTQLNGDEIVSRFPR